MKPTHRCETGGLHKAMQHLADAITPPPITDLDHLLTDDQRRTVSVTINDQIRFQKSIGNQKTDDDFDDLTIADPYEVHASSRKSDAELNRVLSLLDSLDNLENGKEITR